MVSETDHVLKFRRVIAALDDLHNVVGEKDRWPGWSAEEASVLSAREVDSKSLVVMSCAACRPDKVGVSITKMRGMCKVWRG